jgi:fatty acid desaturase
MSFRNTIRRFHRWMSVAFTAGFLINVAAIALSPGGQPPQWVYFTALVPLFVLFPTGLYLFALPWLGRRRSARPVQP